MHLVQILLPIRDNAGAAYPRGVFAGIREKLTAQFGGLTSYTRAPAQGYWEAGESGAVTRDDVVVFEVMTETLDTVWWATFREDLARTLDQKVVVVRSHAITLH